MKLLDALAAYRDSELTTADALLGLTVGGPRPAEEAHLPDPGVRRPLMAAQGHRRRAT